MADSNFDSGLEFRFNEAKATQVAALLLELRKTGRMKYLKLFKLIYLIDRASALIIVDAKRLDVKVANGTVQQHEACLPETLKLIQLGISASPFTPRKVVQF